MKKVLSIGCPTKRPRLECIIHCCDDEKGSRLVSPQSLYSWNSLVSDARIRKHAPILDLMKELVEGEIPPVYYHRKCRSIFTMKKLLEAISKKEDKARGSEDSEIVTSSRLSSRQVSCSCSTVYDVECIFCQKTTKFLRGQKTRECLIQCRELRADSSIRNAAVKKMDSRMLAIVSRDLVAAEGHYHRSYMRQEKVYSSGSHAEDSQEGEYEKALSHSYDELFMYIRNELFTNPKVIAMSDLTSRFVTTMKACGIDQVKDSSKKHLRRKLESVFGQALHIFSCIQITYQSLNLPGPTEPDNRATITEVPHT